MKNFKLLFAAFVLLGSVVACAPNHEEIVPENAGQEVPFNNKSTDEGGDKPDLPKPK